MTAISAPVLISWTLASVFALSGLVHVVMPTFVREAYARWNFPRGFHWVTATLELLAAGFLAVSATRIWGVAVAAVVLFTAVVTLLNHRQYLYAVPGIVLLAALPPALLAAG
jgi:hypothetical protein